MLNELNYSIGNELKKLLVAKDTSHYIFRTRLERILYGASSSIKDPTVIGQCELIMMKLKCLSDQSNQTPDGTLNSYLVLENDLRKLEISFCEMK